MFFSFPGKGLRLRTAVTYLSRREHIKSITTRMLSFLMIQRLIAGAAHRGEASSSSLADLPSHFAIEYRKRQMLEHEEEEPVMHVEMRPIASIQPYENNPRQNDAGIDAVAASIQEFGFRQPIVVDEDGVIIVGHTRYKAALKLGLDMVPVHVAVGLSPAAAKAYRIADNQTATLSQWDDE
jgi:hypothetical protein